MATSTEGSTDGNAFSPVELLTRLASRQQAGPSAAEPAAESGPGAADDTARPVISGSRTLERLVAGEALASLSAAERAAAVVVVAGQEDVDSLLELGPPWPGLVVASRGLQPPPALATTLLLQVDSTRLALATLSEAFDNRPRDPAGVHPSALVDQSARLGADVSVGPGAVIAAGASIGAGSRVRAGSYVGAAAVLGEGCLVHPNVTIYDGVEIGERVVLHAGSVIGADGFGYAASPRGAVKIRHLGGVRLADDVEIGANTAVDRGTLMDTVVGPRTKIDNLCQVGHNVVIGSDCLIAGMTGIAGSVVIGDGVIIGGAAGIADHVSIGSGARIAGRSGVTKSVPAGETWAGFPARPYRQYARGLYLADRLETIWQHLKGRLRLSDDDREPADR